MAVSFVYLLIFTRVNVEIYVPLDLRVGQLLLLHSAAIFVLVSTSAVAIGINGHFDWRRMPERTHFDKNR